MDSRKSSQVNRTPFRKSVYQGRYPAMANWAVPIELHREAGESNITERKCSAMSGKQFFEQR
ncbi:hypothetical protein TcasGA2_TC006005 [Tribolium castaneum]|uniref:Uncharacterized protein n=1 Tax=Tribolium castaneum TaxID=7070 RepID=D6WUL3_TRICA|nr:hypothetical protein TcasGA2_TC006005 [Tribolium castaneum]